MIQIRLNIRGAVTYALLMSPLTLIASYWYNICTSTIDMILCWNIIDLKEFIMIFAMFGLGVLLNLHRRK
jgi:hypothetical protein